MLPFKLHRDNINFHKVIIQDTSFEGRAKDFMTQKITNIALDDAKFQHIYVRSCLLDILNVIDPYTHIWHYFLVQANPDSLSKNQLPNLQAILSQATAMKNIAKVTCNFYYNAALHPDKKTPPEILDRANNNPKLSLLPLQQMSPLPHHMNEETRETKYTAGSIIHTSQQAILDDITWFQRKVYEEEGELLI